MAESKTTASPVLSDEELAEAIVKARSRTLAAVKSFSRLMAEFEGEIRFCEEAMNELLDAADQLDTLERLQHD